MESADVSRQATPSREPVSFTITDLLMLVIGFALVFSLPRLYHSANQIDIDGLPMPRWITWLFMAREVAMKGGLVLVPVIIARRARYGGLPRPADWLAIVISLPMLHELIQRSELMKGFAKWYLVDLLPFLLGYSVLTSGSPSFLCRLRQFSGHYLEPALLQPKEFRDSAELDGILWIEAYDGFPVGFTMGDEERIWGWFTAILLLVILTALGLGWKRIPGWAKTVMFSLAGLAWLSSVTSLTFADFNRITQKIEEGTGFSSNRVISILLGLGSLPEGLLLGVPVVAALYDLRNRVSKNWTWTTWVGAAAAFLALLIGVIVYRYADFVNRKDPIVRMRFVVQLVSLLVVGVVSQIVLHCLRRSRAESVGLSATSETW